MNKFALAFLLFLQVNAAPPGVVTGVVRGADGKPTAGVRVYALSARDAAEESNATPALESLAQTDETGRYRLEITPGRYYIAAGAIGSPTFFPGTSTLTSARVLTVISRAVIDAVDISSFVPAPVAAAGGGGGLVNATTGGTLGGILYTPDGRPAANVSVVAKLGPNNAGRNQYEATTDKDGRYHLDRLQPGMYILAAGFLNHPSFYPGTADRNVATAINVVQTTSIDILDFALGQWRDLSPDALVSMKGRVVITPRPDFWDVTVTIRQQGIIPSASNLDLRLPDERLVSTVRADVDGSFGFRNLPPGTYSTEVLYSGFRTASDTVVVEDLPLTDIALSVSASQISWRILSEDGTPFPTPDIFGEVMITAVNGTSGSASKSFPMVPGTSETFVQIGEYRFSLRTIPEEYTVQSITAGSADLLKQPLKAAGKEVQRIEVKVKPRPATGPAAPSAGVRVSGAASGVLAGNPLPADRVVLCCFDSGPFQRMSAAVTDGGAFAFSSVPPGNYFLWTIGKAETRIESASKTSIVVAGRPLTGIAVGPVP